MLKYWNRVRNRPDDTLVKMALNENVQLRTNWIMTIEKLLNCLHLTDLTDDVSTFNRTVDKNIKTIFKNFWSDTLKNPHLSRLQFYNSIKEDFSFETYFNHRKAIAKLRCPDHALEIEKGRHRSTDRNWRLCKLCQDNEVETEDHFLSKCNF